MTPEPEKNHRPINILLVDDSAADIRLVQEALIEGRIANKLAVATDGDEALRLLKKDGEHFYFHRPDLILLDLNMPRKNGLEVLEEIKATPELRKIPVVILTTSQNQTDINASYDLHANCYISKPVGLPELVHVIKTIENFWLHVATLPRSPDSQE